MPADSLAVHHNSINVPPPPPPPPHFFWFVFCAPMATTATPARHTVATSATTCPLHLALLFGPCGSGTANNRQTHTRMSGKRSACAPVVDVVFSHARRAASSGAPSCRGSARSCASSLTTKSIHGSVGAAYTCLIRRTATKRSCNAVTARPSHGRP